MHLKKLIPALGAVAILGFVAIVGACKDDTSPGDATCDSVCLGVDACGGESCLAMCVRTQTACNVADQASSFAAWVNCAPKISCEEDGLEGGFTLSNCPLQEIGLISCKTSSVSTTTSSTHSSGSTQSDGGGVIIVVPDAGHDVNVVDNDAGETCQETGCDDGFECVLNDGTPTCEPLSVDAGEDSGDDSDDSSSDEDAGCVSQGCTVCLETNGLCETEGTCNDNCGNACCDD